MGSRKIAATAIDVAARDPIHIDAGITVVTTGIVVCVAVTVVPRRQPRGQPGTVGGFKSGRSCIVCNLIANVVAGDIVSSVDSVGTVLVAKEFHTRVASSDSSAIQGDVDCSTAATNGIVPTAAAVFTTAVLAIAAAGAFSAANFIAAASATVIDITTRSKRYTIGAAFHAVHAAGTAAVVIERREPCNDK
jgi:hypothetical protein